MLVCIPKKVWFDLSMNFVLGLPLIRTGQDFILVMDRFLKMAHLIVYKKTEDFTLVAHLFFQEMVHLHGILNTIISDRDLKFISKFTRYLWDKFGM